MHAFLRGTALAAAVCLGSAGVAANAAIDSYKPNSALNFTKVALANGQVVYCRKAGGEQEVYVMNREGKQVPAPPGSYKQKDGHVFVVGNRGVVRPGSTVMLNPQPLPP